MNAIIKGGNAAAMLRITLDKGEMMLIDPDSLVACSDGLEFSKRSDGGMLTRLARRFSRGNFLYQQAHAVSERQWLMLSPALHGSIIALEMRYHETVLVNNHAFLGAAQNVVVGRKIRQLEETGMDSITLSGKGPAYLAGCGAVENMTLLPGQKVFVVTDHLLAYEEVVNCTALPDGMVAMTGPGQLWLQTRQAGPRHGEND